ncbi:MAG: molecular chaperone TorD family protein [Desulfobulbaceae bacterium]|nr:molecular chaperone TorD family protein [Desulfobulbaceae bacterium]
MLNEIRSRLEESAMTYRFLSLVYGHEATSQLLAQLHNELDSQDGLEGGYELLGRYLISIPGRDWDKAAEALATEYAVLFLLGFGKSVSLYESVYVSPKALIMQESRDQVLALYKKEGLARTPNLDVPEDHLAIELDFMGYLVGQANQALENYNRQLAKDYLNMADGFLSQHLLKWVPRLCQDLEQMANSDFYKGIAKITGELLEFEKETFSEMLKILARDDMVSHGR